MVRGRGLRRDLSIEIGRIVAKYSRRTAVSDEFATILADEAKAEFLYQLMEAHVRLIRTRSRRLNDSQVTIYDKALLNLTLSGKNLRNQKALSLFVEEIVGMIPLEVSLAARPSERNDTGANDMLTAAEVAPYDVQTPATHDHTWSAGRTTLDSPSFEQAELGVQTGQPEEADCIALDDRAAEKLFETLEIAKAEYSAARDKPADRRVESAKFLRDTCENVMTYLQDRNIDTEIMNELENVCQMAATDAVYLNEGRKRKFELTREDRRAGKPPARSYSDEDEILLKDRYYRPEYRQPERNDRRQDYYEYDQGRRGLGSSYRPLNDGNGGHHSRSTFRSQSPHSRRPNSRDQYEDGRRAAIRRERRAYRAAHPQERLPLHYTRKVDTYLP